jgi:hypothetical protein
VYSDELPDFASKSIIDQTIYLVKFSSPFPIIGDKRLYFLGIVESG